MVSKIWKEDQGRVLRKGSHRQEDGVMKEDMQLFLNFHSIGSFLVDMQTQLSKGAKTSFLNS